MTTTMISMKIVPRVSIRTRKRKTNEQIDPSMKIHMQFQFRKIRQFNGMRPMHVNGLECVYCRVHFVD